MTDRYLKTPSPVGELTLIADDAGLVAILWEDDRPGRVRLGALVEDRGDPVLVAAAKQLGEYFAGTRTIFDLPLAPRGTDFQLRVWQALRGIRFGQTWSYARLAQAIGNTSAMRAVGAANGRNPIPIIVPCHRVIGANGALTGFGGGMPTKEFLLRLEGALADGLI